MANKLHIPSDNFKTEIAPAKVADAIKAAAAAKLGDLIRVPIAAITVIPDYNVRIRDTDDYKAGIAELEQSIAQNGFYADKPLGVYAGNNTDGKPALFLRSGHRRLEAVEAFNFAATAEAKLADLPCVLVPAATTMEEHLVELVQGNSGKDLTPFEKGLVVKRLIGFGMDKKTIADKLGFTPRYIDDLLVIVGAPAAARVLILNNQVSSTQALRELRKDPAKAAAALTAMVKAAAEKGKGKATAKDKAGATKMVRKVVEVNFGVGDVMGAVLKVLATNIRANVAHAADDTDLIQTDGKLSVVILVPALAAEAKPAKVAKVKAEKPAKVVKPKAPTKAEKAAATLAAANAAGLLDGGKPAGEGEAPDPLAHALGGEAAQTPPTDNSGVEDL